MANPMLRGHLWTSMTMPLPGHKDIGVSLYILSNISLLFLEN